MIARLRDWFYRPTPKPIIMRWLHMRGITFPPFGIFIRKSALKDWDYKTYLLPHEGAHWEQFLQVGFFRFHLWWIGDYTWRSWGRQDSDSIEQDADRRVSEKKTKGVLDV